MTNRDQAAVSRRPLVLGGARPQDRRSTVRAHQREQLSIESSGRRISIYSEVSRGRIYNHNRENDALSLDPAKTGRPVVTGYVFWVLDSIMMPSVLHRCSQYCGFQTGA